MSAPNLFNGSHRRPPPHPISNILIFFKGRSESGLILKWLISFFFIKLILVGFQICNGLNLPFGFHQSLANLENFSIYFLSTVFKIMLN